MLWMDKVFSVRCHATKTAARTMAKNGVDTA